MNRFALLLLVIFPVLGQALLGQTPEIIIQPVAFSPLAAASGVLSESAIAREEAQAESPAAQATADPNSIPNTTVANAYKPYTVGQKFRARTHNVFGPVALVSVGLSAGISQLTNTPSEWEQGAAGYGRRYASAFGVNLTHQYYGFILDSVLHEDPRYFPSSDRSTKARVKSVVRQLFVARKDNGGEEFAFSRWGSAFGAGLTARAWQPRSEAHVGDAIQRGGTILAIDAGLNLAEEFIPFFRHLRP